jgi:hypothetical protein
MQRSARPTALLLSRFLLLLPALALSAGLPTFVYAALGGDITSVEADRVRMKATLLTSQSALYTVHQMQTPYGTTVREFASPSGTVFAVTWQGPFLPDLRQTLGAYFPIYETAPRTAHSGHSHVAVERSDLVVRSGGHPRAFFGLAYVPRLVPAGVSIDQLQ